MLRGNSKSLGNPWTDKQSSKNTLCIAVCGKNATLRTLQEVERFDMLCPLVWLVCKSYTRHNRII